VQGDAASACCGAGGYGWGRARKQVRCTRNLKQPPLKHKISDRLDGGGALAQRGRGLRASRLLVRDGKGGKDRVTMLPRKLAIFAAEEKPDVDHFIRRDVPSATGPLKVFAGSTATPRSPRRTFSGQYTASCTRPSTRSASPPTSKRWCSASHMPSTSGCSAMPAASWASGT